MRDRRRPVVTVGRNGADLEGSGDKAIQAGVEYLHRLGGGTLRIQPGIYTLHNAIHLRPNIVLQGSGEVTVLRKAESASSPLSRDSDWFEYGVRVSDPEGFAPGSGVMLRYRTGPGDWEFEVLRATIVALEDDVLFLDRLTGKDFWIERGATAETIHPLLTAVSVNDVTVRDLVLDGNRGSNQHVNGNFSGALFIENCSRWRLENVTARDYNGDGFSFQVCDDIELLDCRAVNNADLGFHPGSGSQRPVFRRCRASGNSLGLYFCWAVSDGVVEDCILSGNTQFGISIGHRDTDNLITRCTIEGNRQVGILFREDGGEFRGGHRNRIEACVIRDTGGDTPGIGIDIQGATHEVTVRDTRLETTAAGHQETGIRIGALAREISLENNTFVGSAVRIEDLRDGNHAPAETRES
jgi:parallel beta-helix repeat protein